jgi:hypothetical protein
VKETVRVGEFEAVLEVRGRHVLSTETGEVTTAVDMRAYLEQVDRFLARTGTTSVVFDARQDGAPRRGDKETRDVRWDWLQTTKRARQVAVIAEQEIAQTRINMTARARKVNVRAFLDFEGAERWLEDA